MQLRWVVLRTIREPDRIYAGCATPSLSPKIAIVGEVLAGDKDEAKACAFRLFGPRCDVASAVSFEMHRAEDSRLKKRNRTRFVDLMDSGQRHAAPPRRSFR